MKNFSNETLFTLTNWLEEALLTSNNVQFIVQNPDLASSKRGYKIWVNLAELYFCKMLTPTVISDQEICLTFIKLNQESSFHLDKTPNREEKYGVDSKFFHIDKNEEPTFLLAYKRALKAVNIESRQEVLNLGINKADEFDIIQKFLPEDIFKSINFVGIDHSESALAYAQQRFSTLDNMSFIKSDINTINRLNLKKSDLIISIGTLQSPSINYKPFLMSLVQEHLTSNGAFILGFPNSRWIDNELIYGAKAPNYPYSEMSLLFNDVIFAKKYLQQKKFRVTITGREYIFLTATKIKN